MMEEWQVAISGARKTVFTKNLQRINLYFIDLEILLHDSVCKGSFYKVRDIFLDQVRDFFLILKNVISTSSLYLVSVSSKFIRHTKKHYVTEHQTDIKNNTKIKKKHKTFRIVFIWGAALGWIELCSRKINSPIGGIGLLGKWDACNRYNDWEKGIYIFPRKL